MIDRLSVRQPPSGLSVMRQTWKKLLFMHWPVDAEALRPLIPPRLEIDTFEGKAWIGVTPFLLRGLRPPCLPPVPVLSSSHELNVRTYVHLYGVPGIWFFSLDADNPFAVAGARVFFRLPYFRAKMGMQKTQGAIRFTSSRLEGAGPPAEFDLLWRPGDSFPVPPPDSLEFFLIERYAFYAQHAGRLYRCRIHHERWPLREAHLERLGSTMIESLGLPTPAEEPLLHAQAETLHVRVWALEEC